MNAHPNSEPVVLVIDDDHELTSVVTESLNREGFAVSAASSGEEGLSMLRSRCPDLVVLDLGLPDRNGMDVLVEVRGTASVPVIILSGRDSEVDRVLGLEMGADDYVTKPFSARELAARTRAVMRRGDGSDDSKQRTFGELTIDAATREVQLDGTSVDLTAKEFDLLAFLAWSPRQVFSPDQILRAVWESDPAWQNSSTVSEHVYRLRRKLSSEDHDWIVTVRGAGYRFEPG